MKSQIVMFVCPTHDGRSQIAAALANAMYVPLIMAESAALAPQKPHPIAVQVMREIGLDIASIPPRTIARTMLRHPRFDYVISLCREAHEMPLPGNLKYGTHWLWDCPPLVLPGMDLAEMTDHMRLVRDGLLSQIIRWGDSLSCPPRMDMGCQLFERAMALAA